MAEGGRVGVSDMREWMGRVIWLAAALCSYVNHIFVLPYGLFAGALSHTICCLILCF